MKVAEIKYERVDLSAAADALREIIEEVRAAGSPESLLELRNRTVEISREAQSMSSLAYIRFTLNTLDGFYLEEKNYYDENLPVLSALASEYNRAFLANPHSGEAFSRLNPNVRKVYELSVRVMDEKIVPELVEEAKLVTEYDRIMSEITFPFRGKREPLSVMKKYFDDADRNVRRESMSVVGAGLKKKQKKIEGIFDRLVKVRTRMAEKLGYSSYAELGDGLMGRYSYGRKEIRLFREEVMREVVPLVTELRKKAAENLGIDRIMLYDSEAALEDGPPEPRGSAEELFSAGEKMYSAISEEAGTFFREMMSAGAFDVFPRKGKWGGGYCTSIDSFEQPFILANFNGSSGDVDVLTHEAGHAFAYYEMFRQKLDYELNLGTMSVAEIHSMAMELLAYPYAGLFFDKADEYRYVHLLSSLTFIPYGTMVDHFEELCYDRPDMTPAERNEAWKELEKMYRPYLSADGIPYFEEGTRWQYQMHIFENPMYYIDYCLSQTIAHEIYIESAVDYKKAMAKYLFIIKNGGEKAFEELVLSAGLKSPFSKGTAAETASEIRRKIGELSAAFPAKNGRKE